MIHPTQNKSLKQKLYWHLKIIIGAFFIALFFSIVLSGKVFNPQLPGMWVITIIQLEIFIWLGALFFNSLKVGAPGFKKKLLIRLLIFYLSVMAIAGLFFILIFFFYFLKGSYEFDNFFTALQHLEMKQFFTSTLVGFTLGTLFFFYVQWDEALKREQKLTQEKLIFQYETLKKQVNPHFLFNSLNTLSSLVRGNPELSEKFIQKLSAIYRFVLDNEEKELVPVASEMKFVKDFFYLQKIRDEEKIELKIEVNNKQEMQIVPVSLQLLVENALKHNSATRSQPLLIIVHDEGLDKIVVRNNLQKKTQLNESSKIGLKNLNERCRLILNREIEVQETPDEFVVKVPVKIK